MILDPASPAQVQIMRNVIPRVPLTQAMGGALAGLDLVLLHQRRRQTGKPYVTPVTGMAYENGYLLLGSFAGADAEPQWVKNVENATRVIAEDLPALPRHPTDPMTTPMSGNPGSAGEKQDINPLQSGSGSSCPPPCRSSPPSGRQPGTRLPGCPGDVRARSTAAPAPEALPGLPRSRRGAWPGPVACGAFIRGCTP